MTRIWDAHIDVTGTLWNQPTVTKEVREAMAATQQRIKDLLPGLTPVKTGRMRASWNVDAGDRILRITNRAQNKQGTQYAGFVDLGTSKMKPRHITKQAMEQAMSIFTQELSGRLEEKFGGRRTKASRDFAVAIAKLAKRETAIGVTTRTPSLR